MTQVLRFSENFFFGAATAAHQVEGNTSNQWTDWEIDHADEWAHRGPDTDYGLGSMPKAVYEVLKDQIHDPSNYVSGIGADHYHRYEEDFDILCELNLGMYRFSVEWSRVEPDPGQFDQTAIDHYVKVVRALRERGIEPMVTLWHWTVPSWFEDQGGWTVDGAPQLFERFAGRMAEALGPEVTYYTTLNEPEVYTVQGFVTGEWPPGKVKSVKDRGKVRQHLAAAHRLAYQEIHRVNANAQVGLAQSQALWDTPFGLSWPFRKLWTWFSNRDGNHWFLRQLSDHLDFIGLQAYWHGQWRFAKPPQLVATRAMPKPYRSDLGWSQVGRDVHRLLTGLKQYGKPVFVTESGLADHADQYRAQYIDESLMGIYQAIQAGVDIRGYLHWSLLDNFEWDKGFWPQFGLVHIDRKTLKRTIRPSAFHYAEIASARGVKVEA